MSRKKGQKFELLKCAEINIDNKFMKKCAVLFTIREIQVKITLGTLLWALAWPEGKV